MSDHEGMAAWQMNNAARVLFALGVAAAAVASTYCVIKWLVAG